MVFLEGLRQLNEASKWTLGVVVGVILLGVLAIEPGWAPVILTLILWGLSWLLGFFEELPQERLRFATALLVAWAVDAILFIVVRGEAPRAYREYVSAVVVVSIFAGYLANRTMSQWATEIPKDRSFWIVGSFLLAIFLMFNVVNPTMHHFFPRYWAKAIINALEINSDGDTS